MGLFQHHCTQSSQQARDAHGEWIGDTHSVPYQVRYDGI